MGNTNSMGGIGSVGGDYPEKEGEDTPSPKKKNEEIK